MVALQLSIDRRWPLNQQTCEPRSRGYIPLPVRRQKRVDFLGVSDEDSSNVDEKRGIGIGQGAGSVF
jgi:hypothetical protein